MAGIFDPNIFQNESGSVGQKLFQVDVGNDTGGGTGFSGGTFSRGRWHKLKKELEEAREAQQRLADAEIESKRAKAAAARAAEIAQQAIEAAEAYAVEVEVTKLANALDAASGASRVADIVKQSQAVVRIARAIIQQIEEEEEEEEIIAFLLMT